MSGEDKARNEILDSGLSVARVFAWLIIGWEELAILFRPFLSDAVYAGCASLPKRFLYGDEFWLAMQVRAARNVIELVILVHGYCDGSHRLKRIGLLDGAMRIMPVEHGFLG